MQILGIDHALVTDTDSMQQGGYALVAASEGVTAEEHVFLNENSGISDYLHHSGEDRTYFSFFPIGHRYAFVRRFTQGKRRGSQDRIVVHTLLLNRKDLDALDWLPWLIAEGSFSYAGGREQFPLTKDAIAVPADGVLPRLDFQSAIASMDDILAKLQKRMSRLHSQFGEARAPALLAEVMDAMARRLRVLLPQGAAFEQLALTAWSLLPPADRQRTAWTQHLAPGIRNVSFAIANASDPQLIGDLYGGRSVWRIVNPSSTTGDVREFRNVIERQLSSAAERSQFNDETSRWQVGFSIDPDAFRRWINWTASVRGGMSDSESDLETLSRALHATQRDPWVDDDAVLRFALGHAKRLKARSSELAIQGAIGDLQRHEIRDVLASIPLPYSYIQRLSEDFGELFVLTFLLRAAETTKREREVVRVATDALVLHPPTKETEALARSLIERLRKFDTVRRDALSNWLPKSREMVEKLVSSLRTHEESLDELFGHYQTSGEEGKRIVLDKALPIFAAGSIGAARSKLWLGLLRNDAASYVDVLSHSGEETVVQTLLDVARSMDDPSAAAIGELLLAVERPVFARLPEFASVVEAYARRPGRPETWFHQLTFSASVIDRENDRGSINSFAAIVERLSRGDAKLPAGITMATTIAQYLKNSMSPDDACLRAIVSLGGSSLHARPELCSALVDHLKIYDRRAAAWQSLAVEMIGRLQASDGATMAYAWWMALHYEKLIDAAPMLDVLDRMSQGNVAAVVSKWRELLPRIGSGPTCDEFVVRLRRIAARTQTNGNTLWLDALWREYALRRMKLEKILIAADDPNEGDSLFSSFDSRCSSYFPYIVDRVRQFLAILDTSLTPSARRWLISRTAQLIRALREQEWRDLHKSMPIGILLTEWPLAMACVQCLVRFDKSDLSKDFVEVAMAKKAFDVLAALHQQSVRARKTRKAIAPARSRPGAFYWIGATR